MAWSRPLAMISLAASLLGSTGCEIRGEDEGDGGAGPADADRRDAPWRCPDDLDFDGIEARHEGDGDPDRDGAPNHVDPDSDGDGILDSVEAGDADCDSAPVDSDRDGTPDFLDLDSDGDTISDAQETAGDRDGDGTPNYLDLDTDDDGRSDAEEAGDADLDTPAASCAAEDPDDGAADFADVDSDGDGLGDGEEIALGTSPCDVDSDDDGQDDLAEGAYERVNCPDRRSGVGCGCATDPGCRIPPQHFYVVLEHGASTTRDLDFATDVRRADVFFLIDTTGSMGGTLSRIQSTLAAPGTGLVARITESVPDAWFGGGELRDFPFSSYGGEGDEPFRLAIEATPPERAADVALAFAAMSAAGGGDGPEAHVEALHRALTGEGETWEYERSDGARATYSMRSYTGDCLEERWGAACFRPATLPVLVLFTDTCAHGGPPEDSSCEPHAGMSPPSASWADTVALMRARGARFVGVNASGASCAGVTDPSGFTPCFFLRSTAEATGSVDLEGAPLVYDLPSGGASDTVFTDTVVGALETMVTRVPLDVDTWVRDDPTDPEGVDARAFVGERVPACGAGAATCWSAPEGVPHEDAVADLDDARFLDVVPGTRVTFRVTFRNDSRIGGPRSEVHVAFIDVRGEGNAVLDTRQVYVVVPANDDLLPG